MQHATKKVLMVGKCAATPCQEPASGHVGALVALVSDLMLATRLEASASTAGFNLVCVDSLALLDDALRAGPPSLVIIDLQDRALSPASLAPAIARCRPHTAVLAFYPHVQQGLKAWAEQAGCDLVVPRSRLLLDLPGTLNAALAMRRR